MNMPSAEVIQAQISQWKGTLPEGWEFRVEYVDTEYPTWRVFAQHIDGSRSEPYVILGIGMINGSCSAIMRDLHKSKVPGNHYKHLTEVTYSCHCPPGKWHVEEIPNLLDLDPPIVSDNYAPYEELKFRAALQEALPNVKTMVRHL